jgi:zona occludens toxin
MSATQPITLITATPGGGKTALAVKMMVEAVKQGRPLFMQGIPELKLPYIPLPAVDEWTETRVDPEDPDQRSLPYFTFPENALIVIDEAQRIFRVRVPGSRVPDHVAAFETVRHTGVTFLLITQSPAFLDTHIRKLVGQHIHLRDVGMLGRWWYEWPEVGNPEAFRTAPIKKKFSLPKSSFALYKSASLHIKRKYTVPPALMIIAVCLVIGSFLAYRIYGNLHGKFAPESVAAAKTGEHQADGGKVSSSTTAQSKPAGPSPTSTDAAEILASFVPVVPGRPETAPAYAALRQVKSMPTVVGGACVSTRCVCYTQQGTDAGLDDSQCRGWLQKRPFDPYRDPQAAQLMDAPRSDTALQNPASAPAAQPQEVRIALDVSRPSEAGQEPRRRTVVGSGRARRVDELQAFPEG